MADAIPQNALTCDLALGQEAVHGCLAKLRNVRDTYSIVLQGTRGLGLLFSRSGGVVLQVLKLRRLELREENVHHLLTTGCKTLLFSCYVKFSSHTAKIPRSRRRGGVRV